METHLIALGIGGVGFVIGFIVCAFFKVGHMRDMLREREELKRRIEELEGRGC